MLLFTIHCGLLEVNRKTADWSVVAVSPLANVVVVVMKCRLHLTAATFARTRGRERVELKAGKGAFLIIIFLNPPWGTFMKRCGSGLCSFSETMPNHVNICAVSEKHVFVWTGPESLCNTINHKWTRRTKTTLVWVQLHVCSCTQTLGAEWVPVCYHMASLPRWGRVWVHRHQPPSQLTNRHKLLPSISCSALGLFTSLIIPRQTQITQQTDWTKANVSHWLELTSQKPVTSTILTGFKKGNNGQYINKEINTAGGRRADRLRETGDVNYWQPQDSVDVVPQHSRCCCCHCKCTLAPTHRPVTAAALSQHTCVT